MINYIIKPIIIIGCNRSGTTLLFRNLSSHPDLWSLYIESQEIFYKHYPIHPDMGDRIVELASESIKEDILLNFYNLVHNKEYFKEKPILKYIPLKLIQKPVNKLYKRAPVRIVEKTPANCFRIPFLLSLFPDAKFIFLIRRPEDVISSLMEGWKIWSNAHGSNWRFNKWHYLVPPGWRKMIGKKLEEICAFQWVESNKTAWEDLNKYCKNKFLFISHEYLIENPLEGYKTILDFCELEDSKYFQKIINKIDKRIYTTRGTKPMREKWKKLHYKEIQSVRHIFEPLYHELYSKLET